MSFRMPNGRGSFGLNFDDINECGGAKLLIALAHEVLCPGGIQCREEVVKTPGSLVPAVSSCIKGYVA